MCRAKIWTQLSGTTSEWSKPFDVWYSRILSFRNLQVYSHDERAHFLSTVLSNICYLAMNVDQICTRVEIHGLFDWNSKGLFLVAATVVTDRVEPNGDDVPKTSGFVVSLRIFLFISAEIQSESRQWIWELSKSEFQYVRLTHRRRRLKGILLWRLFHGGRTGGPTWKLEKLRCVLHYFKRITEKSKVT